MCGTGWGWGLGPWPSSVAREREGSQDRPPQAHPVEGLRHLPQEVLGDLDPLLHRQVEVGVREVLLDPAGQFATLVGPGKPLSQAGEGEEGDIRPPAGEPGPPSPCGKGAGGNSPGGGGPCSSPYQRRP